MSTYWRYRPTPNRCPTRRRALTPQCIQKASISLRGLRASVLIWSTPPASSTSARSPGEEVFERLKDVGDHPVRQPGVHADPERVVHDDVAVRETADDAVLDVQVRGLAREVAAEEQARRDPTPLQKTDEFASSEGGAGADGDDEPEPTRVAQRRLVGDAAPPHVDGDVVGRIEAGGAEVSYGTGQPSPVRRTEGVTVVLDEPQAVALRDLANRVEIEGVLERVGDHHRSGTRA